MCIYTYIDTHRNTTRIFMTLFGIRPLKQDQGVDWSFMDVSVHTTSYTFKQKEKEVPHDSHTTTSTHTHRGSDTGHVLHSH